MRASIIATAVATSLLAPAAAFLPATPLHHHLARPRTSTTRMALDAHIVDATSNLVAIVKENDVFVKQAGEYAWGSVQAPEWALPVAAIATLSFGVLIPLFLKPGVDAFNAGENAGRSKAVETTVVLKGGKVVNKTLAKPLAASPKATATARNTFSSSSGSSSSKKAASPSSATSSSSNKKWGLF